MNSNEVFFAEKILVTGLGGTFLYPLEEVLIELKFWQE